MRALHLVARRAWEMASHPVIEMALAAPLFVVGNATDIPALYVLGCILQSHGSHRINTMAPDDRFSNIWKYVALAAGVGCSSQLPLFQPAPTLPWYDIWSSPPRQRWFI
jgi:hypothetical protein